MSILQVSRYAKNPYKHQSTFFAMKPKRVFRFTISFLSLNLFLFLAFLFFPSWLYAHRTDLGPVAVYHHQPLPEGFDEIVRESIEVIKKSELYQPAFRSEVCLNDGALYPKLVRTALGDDVFRAFEQKAVMLGELSDNTRVIRARGRELNTVQFLSHAFVHNLQYQYHGFLEANPLGGHPEWKWEGYVEYIVLQPSESLAYYHELLSDTEGPFDWIELEGGMATIRMHIEFMMLTKYCFEQKNWSYQEFVDDTTSREVLWQEMEESCENEVSGRLLSDIRVANANEFGGE